MNKIPDFKGYFIDLDGTSLDATFLHRDNGYFYGFSKLNTNLIIENNKKVPIIISTGRDKHYVEKLLPRFGIKYGICQNGSVIIDNKGNILKQININKKYVLKLIDLAFKHKLGVKINDDQGFYGGSLLVRVLSKLIKTKKFKHKLDIDSYLHFNKICIFGRFQKRMKPILKSIEDMNDPISVVSTNDGLMIEVTDIKATKGTAALWVCKKLNLDPKKCVHVGDTSNDIPAFIALGSGIAMDNALDSVKENADYITSHYRKNGLKNVFLKKMKINKNKINF